MSIDYRALNKVSIRDYFLILKIDEILDKLRDAKFFTILNLDNTYH